MSESAQKPAETESLGELAHLSELIQTLLLNRGITTKEEAQAFLNPHYAEHTHDPHEMVGMEESVERIIQAIEDKERIVIFSDYDTDGIPGAVILHDVLTQIGFENFENYIPHRNKEGFGLSIEAVESFADKDTDLLITVDCGITAVEAVAKANESGMDVIITDHHLPNGEVPDAFAIINSKQQECSYPEENLCGAAVAFKLAQALIEKLREDEFEFPHPTPEGWEKWLLDMVGIATVSDMVPLRGENRVLAHYGLHVLRKSPRPGLHHLLKKARVKQEYLTEDDIGYVIGPRINAASRMDSPEDAFRLLATKDEAEAGSAADHLQTINNKRKGVVSAMVKKIKKKLASRDNLGPVIVTGNPEWKPSLLGLACNSLVDEYERPVFLWGRDGSGKLKGSCRGDESVNLVDLMAAVEEGVLTNFGGHANSGGFGIEKEAIHTLEEHLNNAYKKSETTAGRETAPPDVTLTLDDVNWDTYDEIKQLKPFGEGNPKPVFRFESVEIESVSHFGKANNHLKLIFRKGNGKQLEAIEFFATAESYNIPLSSGKIVTLHAHIEKSVFAGRTTVRLRIVNILDPDV